MTNPLFRWIRLVLSVGLLVGMCLNSSATATSHVEQVEPGSKLTYRLQQLSRHAPSQISSLASNRSTFNPTADLMINRQGAVMVYIRLVDLHDGALEAVKSTGARVDFVAHEFRVVTAWVQPDRLEAVAALAQVENVQEMLRPMTFSELEGQRTSTTPAQKPLGASTCDASNVGSVTTEGVIQLGVNTVRSQHQLDGTGIKIGVISVSFNIAYDYGLGKPLATNYITDTKSGDLPGSANPCGRTTPVDVRKELPLATAQGGGLNIDEGRAMLQLVHDIAPGATLMFHEGVTGGIFGLPAAIRALRAAGADIIVDNMYYPDQEPFFQDAPGAAAISEVTNSGGFYFTSVGSLNWLLSGTTKSIAAYEAPAFRPMPCPALKEHVNETQTVTVTLVGECHDFNPEVAQDVTGGYTLTNFLDANLMFQYAEPWFGVQSNFDVYAVDDSNTILTYQNSPTSVAPSKGVNINNGPTGTQRPSEMLSVSNFYNSPLKFNVIIHRNIGATTPAVKLLVPSSVSSAEYVPPDNPATTPDRFGGTVTGHRMAKDAISVASVPYNDLSIGERSSRGYATVYYGPIISPTASLPLPAPEVRMKPDVSATHGGGTTFFGRNPLPSEPGVYRFYGASAAAPHAAGVGALVLQYYRKYNAPINATTMNALLRGTAKPIPNTTPADAGGGLVQADAAMTQLVACAAGSSASCDLGARPGVPGIIIHSSSGVTTTVMLQTGSLTQTTTLRHTSVPTVTTSLWQKFAGMAFDLNAQGSSGALNSFRFTQPISITIQYTDANVAGLNEQSLRLHYWNGTRWVDIASECGTTYVRDVNANRLSVGVCHLSRFALLGEPRGLSFMPLVVR